MLGRDRPNVWAYDRYATTVLSYHIYDNYSHGPWNVYFAYTSHFIVSTRYYSTSSSSMRFSFFWNFNYYYHEYHGIENSFHNHILIYVHGFGMISHSFQGMVHIRLNETCDFSSKAHYFAQQ